MRTLGWLAGFWFSVALIIPGCAAILLFQFHHLLWWEIIKRLGPEFPGWPFWWGLFIIFGLKLWLPYKIVEMVSVRLADWMVAQRPIWLIAYSLLSEAAFVAFVFWENTLGNSPTFHFTLWIAPPLAMAFAGPSMMFWIPLSKREAARKAPPRWVGPVNEFGARYNLWKGFMKPTLALGRWFSGEELEPPANDAFGAAHEASDDDLRKAGFL